MLSPWISKEGALSIEGGMSGTQQRLVCPDCGKVFFAWRPDELPGVKIKCYFCRHEFADEAAQRVAPAPPLSPAFSSAQPSSSPETTETSSESEATKPAPASEPGQ